MLRLLVVAPDRPTDPGAQIQREDVGWRRHPSSGRASGCADPVPLWSRRRSVVTAVHFASTPPRRGLRHLVSFGVLGEPVCVTVLPAVAPRDELLAAGCELAG